jgi:tetratricopeptide (TPR) repeat protein
MKPPSEPRASARASLSPVVRFPLLAFALTLAAPAAQAQTAASRIPLAAQVAEVEPLLAARKPADAATLLDEIVSRVRAGENLPPGLSLERLLLTTAQTHFQTGNLPRAAELAEALEKIPSTPAALLGEARMVRGLSLALQKDYIAAIPVFAAAEASAAHRDKALLYGALAAREAGRLPVAIAAYNRLLATAPRDRDWADAALSLVELHLRADNLADARRGLALLRGQLALVDNLAGLNLLSLQLGDALLKSGDPAHAIEAFRTITARDALLAEQKRRNAILERALERTSALARPSSLDLDAIRRLDARLTQSRASLAEVEKLPAFDAALHQHLAAAFQERGNVWEAALLLEDLLARHPEHPEREAAWFALVRAYADAGRLEKVRDAVERFLAAHPDSTLGPRALYLAAEAAGQRNDLPGQLAFLDLADQRFPPNDLTEPIRLLRANALFALARYAEARTVAVAYLADFPRGRFLEEARYLASMSDLAEGRATDAEKQIRDYLRDFPEGRFVPDARYRLAATAYSLQDYAVAGQLCTDWLAAYPCDQPQRGEVLSLQGDALAGLGDIPGAITAYHASLDLPLSDEQLGYVLDELTRHYQARRDYEAAVALWQNFAAARPDHPYVINAAYWISRIRAREGRPDEALPLVAKITRRYLGDPSRADVERLLVELAATLARPPRARANEPKPVPAPESELFARADELLLDGNTREAPTARARALFVHAEIAAARQNPALRDETLGKIAATYAPDQLPAGILGKVGDALLAQNQPEFAASFYERLIAAYPRSLFADYGYVGLGEISLRADRPEEALARFDAAIDVAGARSKLKEATLGRARARLALGQLDAARALFEEVAANRAWRGEATAEALFHLGEIAARRATPDDLAKAQAHYQRIYLSYKRFPGWVAKAYLRSAETFDRLGQPAEALTTLNRMLTEEHLAPYPEWQKALALKPALEARAPAQAPTKT